MHTAPRTRTASYTRALSRIAAAAAAAAICAAQAYAAGPFGLEINQSSIEDVKQKVNCDYKTFGVKTDIYPGGGAWLEFGGCSLLPNMYAADMVFNDDGVLVAAYLKFNGKAAYDDLAASLGQKYRRTSAVEPFVGDRSSTYALKGQTITLRAPHLSFDTFLDYESADYLERSRKAAEQRKRQQQSNTASQL